MLRFSKKLGVIRGYQVDKMFDLFRTSNGLKDLAVFLVGGERQIFQAVPQAIC